jgi:mannose-6-phosphate isomerase-like protein (cupin superfamily)
MKNTHIISTGLTHGISISQIILEPNESTQRHYHQKTTEVYSISSGQGIIQCADSKTFVEANSVVIIEPNIVHQIINTGDEELVVLSCKDKPRQFRDYFPM